MPGTTSPPAFRPFWTDSWPNHLCRAGCWHHAHLPARPPPIFGADASLGWTQAFGPVWRAGRHRAVSPTRPRRWMRYGRARTSLWSRRPRPASRCAISCQPSRRWRRIPPLEPSSSSYQGPGQDQVAELGELSRAGEPAHQLVTYDGRHTQPDPIGDPSRGTGRGHEPGHAARSHPASSHQMVSALRATPLHRHRRTAHLPRPFRQPRRERAAPATADLCPLWLTPGNRVLLRHHRESREARHPADGARLAGHRPGTARRRASATS